MRITKTTAVTRVFASGGLTRKLGALCFSNNKSFALRHLNAKPDAVHPNTLNEQAFSHIQGR